MGGVIRRLGGWVLVCVLLLSAVPSASAATTVVAPVTLEARVQALEQRMAQLERLLALTSLDVVSLVSKSAPAVVSLYQVDNKDRVLSQGTGFIIHEDGLIITNAHVVEDGYKVKVKFADGKVLPAEIKLVDAFLDMALLDIEGTGHPTLNLAETKPNVGEPVVVIGNAFGYSNSVTAGIVSGVDRPDPYHYHHFPSLQTDAAINHGNSGGPILNAQGEVVAMATWTELKDETDSIAFGIPADQIEAALKRVDAKRGVVRPWLGVSAREPYWARGGLPNDVGLLLAGVHPLGAAAKAGMRRGDWLTKVNGKPINYLMDLRMELERYKPGDLVSITVERESELTRDWVVVELTVRMGEFSSAVKQLVPFDYEEGTDDLF